jgi:hypothetical protein
MRNKWETRASFPKDSNLFSQRLKPNARLG